MATVFPLPSGELLASSPEDPPSSSSCSAAVSVFPMLDCARLLLLSVDVVVEDALPKEGVVLFESYGLALPALLLFADFDETKVLTA